jgi:predicted nucleotidyltransferase
MANSTIDDPILRRFRVALDEIYGSRLERVVLFGSRARGNAREASDYDVAVFIKDIPRSLGNWTGLPKRRLTSSTTPAPSSTRCRLQPGRTGTVPDLCTNFAGTDPICDARGGRLSFQGARILGQSA